MARIGILGGGQLALMLAHSAIQLGHTVVIWDSSPEACAQHLGTFIHADFTDPVAKTQFLSQVDVITWEFENLPLNVISEMAQSIPIFPSRSLLQIKRDRFTEKQYLESIGIPVVPYIEVNTIDDITQFPVVLKTRQDGYDGKGQYILCSEKDLHAIQDDIVPGKFIAESWVNFEKELSIIGTRDLQGDIVAYDVAENVHTHGILHYLHVEQQSSYQSKAMTYLSKLLNKNNYVGTLAIEFFVVNNELVVNEYAPRVHNTGHWTIEGASTSQFENHIRAITGMPLTDTKTISYPIMINIVGKQWNNTSKDAHAYYHWYGKSERVARKLGHVTILAQSETTIKNTVQHWKEKIPFIT